MGIKFDGTIKLDVTVNIAISASVIIAVLLSNNQTKVETQQQINEIPQEVKDITRADLIKIFEKTNLILTKANQSALTDKQMITIQKQILNEVR